MGQNMDWMSSLDCREWMSGLWLLCYAWARVWTKTNARGRTNSSTRMGYWIWEMLEKIDCYIYIIYTMWDSSLHARLLVLQYSSLLSTATPCGDLTCSRKNHGHEDKPRMCMKLKVIHTMQNPWMYSLNSSTAIWSVGGGVLITDVCAPIAAQYTSTGTSYVKQ